MWLRSVVEVVDFVASVGLVAGSSVRKVITRGGLRASGRLLHTALTIIKMVEFIWFVNLFHGGTRERKVVACG